MLLAPWSPERAVKSAKSSREKRVGGRGESTEPQWTTQSPPCRHRARTVSMVLDWIRGISPNRITTASARSRTRSTPADRELPIPWAYFGFRTNSISSPSSAFWTASDSCPTTASSESSCEPSAVFAMRRIRGSPPHSRKSLLPPRIRRDSPAANRRPTTTPALTAMPSDEPKRSRQGCSARSLPGFSPRCRAQPDRKCGRFRSP